MRWQILYQTLTSETKYAGEKYSLKGLYTIAEHQVCMLKVRNSNLVTCEILTFIENI